VARSPLNRLMDENRVDRKDWIWAEGFTDWMKIGSVL